MSGTVGSELDEARRRLERAGVAEARLDAELLLADLLQTDRGGLLVRHKDPLAPAIAARYRIYLSRRERREPLQQITGRQEFFGLTFEVDRHVLVPRPETEGLIDALVELPLRPDARIADLGTGSGCIVVTLATLCPGFRLHALDRSAEALRVARSNAQRHQVDSRIEWVRADLADAPRSWLGRMDVVISNPPYVTESDWADLQPEVRDHEPREALVPGPSGMEAYARIGPVAFELLRPGGRLVLELGHGQRAGVQRIVEQAGMCTEAVRPDLRGIPRVLLARRP